MTPKSLYLVNRQILKDQLEEELSVYPVGKKNRITLMTYQYIERKLYKMKSDNEYYEFCERFRNYDYIVCDEAHYFSSDSNFNTNTNASYNWIRNVFYNKIRIYISATLDLVEQKISNDVKSDGFFHECNYDLVWNELHLDDVRLLQNYKVIKYEGERNYSYFDCSDIVNPNELSTLVKIKKGKWLIFVDDICLGKELENDIKNKLKGTNDDYDSNVLFLTAEYYKSQETSDAVDEIAQKKCQSAKVLISTSVMENGVSIKDSTVKNIVIGIDVEDQFIQMLGRKRVDENEKINLFLLKKSKSQIRNRLYEVKQAKKLSDECGREIQRVQDAVCKSNFNGGSPTIGNIDPNLRWISDEYFELMKKAWENGARNENAWNKHFAKIRNMLISKIDMIAKKNFMVHNEASWKIFYLNFNIFYANLFSMQRIEYLVQYYSDLLNEFDIYGDNALVRRQLMWMGNTEEQANNIIKELDDKTYENSKEKIISKFEEIACKKMSKDDWIKIKVDLKSEFLDLVNSSNSEKTEEWKQLKEVIEKNDRPFSAEKMTLIKELFGIPFILKKERDKDKNKDVFWLVKDE